MEIIKYNAYKSIALNIQLCTCPCSHLPRETEESATWQSLFVCYSTGACLPAFLPSALMFPPSFLFPFVCYQSRLLLPFLPEKRCQHTGARNTLADTGPTRFIRALLTLVKQDENPWQAPPRTPIHQNSLPLLDTTPPFYTSLLELEETIRAGERLSYGSLRT